MTNHQAILRAFPWFDAVGAGGFLVFAMVTLDRLREGGDSAFVRIGVAGATLVFGVSLLLDGMTSGMTAMATGATPDAAPTLLGAAHGVESLFPYPLAMFLGAVGTLFLDARRRWLGATAVAIGVGFLVSAALPVVDLDLELEGPLFMALLVWILVCSATLIRSGGAA